MKIFLTGGAGFIGSALARSLVEQQHDVIVVDCSKRRLERLSQSFTAQQHSALQLIFADLNHTVAWQHAMSGVDVVVHLAARIGTGQSQYQMARYTSANVSASAALLDVVAKSGPSTLRRIIHVSSRAVYGEGSYSCLKDGTVFPSSASTQDKLLTDYDPTCPKCGGRITPQPTDETAPHTPASWYGLTKAMQEQMLQQFTSSLSIPNYVFRLQNVFGPGQALGDPYSGIISTFIGLGMTGSDLVVFENGTPTRDFIYLDDVVTSLIAAINSTCSSRETINIGTGISRSLFSVASRVARHYGVGVLASPIFRKGDVRHSTATTHRAEALLGFRPTWSFDDGLAQTIANAPTPPPNLLVRHHNALVQLKARGLLLSPMSFEVS